MLRGVLVFTVTYLLIAGRRLRVLPLDRPAGALTGAVLAVALGVLTPRQAIAAVNGETLVLLFGLMGVGAFLAADGILDRAGDRLMAWARTPSRLLGGLVWGAGLLSALVTNDAVCVIGAPLVVAWVERHRLPALPFLLALATAANTGSVATLVGNPQNMLCATLGGLGYRSYLVHMLPVALVGLAANHVILVTAFRRELAIGTLARELPRAAPRERRAGVTLAVVALTVVIYLAGGDLAFTALGGFTALLLVHRADPTTFWARIDWSVLVFFAGLFVAVECLVASGAAAAALARFPIDAGGTLAGWVRVAVVFLVGSNVVSNVPFILVVKDAVLGMSNPTLAWELLAMASTFAGNLTLLGSVANIIVAERGRTLGGLPFFAHLRIGFPLTLVTTALGTAWLLWLHGVR